jgi:lipid-A-disaccharide synthase
MIVAAEASGDTLGADLMRVLGAADPPPRIIGIGGAAMTAQGLQSPIDIAGLSILGLFEGVRAYPRIQHAINTIVALAMRERPAAVVLIDSWGLSIRVAQRLRRLAPELLLFKYVGPQVWAHRAGRAKKIADAFDHLLSTNTLDLPYYRDLSIPVTFVGNPALNTDFTTADAARFRHKIGAGADPILLVLLGSRPAEISQLSGPFGEAAALLVQQTPSLRIVVPVAESVAEQVRVAVSKWGVSACLIEAADDKKDAMIAATAAIACSGTVTTELALAGCPMVVGYRLGRLSYTVLKPLFKLRYVTLLNIVADTQVAPELLQRECTGAALANAAAPLLHDREARAHQVQAQTAALTLMGAVGGDPSMLAAASILDAIDARATPPN